MATFASRTIRLLPSHRERRSLPPDAVACYTVGMPKKTRMTGRSPAKPIGSPPDSKKLLAQLRGLIESARTVVAQAVNSGLVLLYWQVGNQIRSTMLGNKRAE